MQISRAAWTVLCELSPWLLLGMLVSGLLHGLLPAGFIHRKLRGPGGVLKAVALGVPLPLCSCGVVPAGIGLKRDGASDGAAVGFLISTPQTGVDSILLSASALGWPFALFKVFSAAVTGIAGGLLADAVQLTSRATAARSTSPARNEDHSFRGMLQHALEILRSIWFWLVLGVLVSAAIEIYLPTTVLGRIAGWGSIPAALVALSISLPLYVCAVASVPIAAALVSNGLPAGAALVFLMAGPATNVATIGSVYRTFGLRTLSVYLGTIVLGSIGFAAVFDALPLASLDHASPHHHHGSSWLQQVSALVLVAMIVWFACGDLRFWLKRRTAATSDGPGFKVSVSGMTCNDCAHRLERQLYEANGVDRAVVHVEPGEAIVHGAIGEMQLRELIGRVGFQAGEVVGLGPTSK